MSPGNKPKRAFRKALNVCTRHSSKNFYSTENKKKKKNIKVRGKRSKPRRTNLAALSGFIAAYLGMRNSFSAGYLDDQWQRSCGTTDCLAAPAPCWSEEADE